MLVGSWINVLARVEDMRPIHDSTNTLDLDITQKSLPVEPFRERQGDVDSLDRYVELCIICIFILLIASVSTFTG